MTFFASPEFWWWGDLIAGRRSSLIAAFILLLVVVARGFNLGVTHDQTSRWTCLFGVGAFLNATLVHFALAADPVSSYEAYILLAKFTLLFFLITAAIETRFPGTPIVPYMAPYGTDGKEIRRGGIPTYGVMGLFLNENDAFAHGLNERVLVRSFFGALEHWYVMLNRLAGRAAM